MHADSYQNRAITTLISLLSESIQTLLRLVHSMLRIMTWPWHQ